MKDDEENMRTNQKLDMNKLRQNLERRNQIYHMIRHHKHKRPPEALGAIKFLSMLAPTIIVLIILIIAQDSSGQRSQQQQQQQVLTQDNYYDLVNNYSSNQSSAATATVAADGHGARLRRFAGGDATSSAAGSSSPPPTSGSVWDLSWARAQATPPASEPHWPAPRFALEPPALVEYSNSTGTVIGCRPQPAPASGGPIVDLSPGQRQPHSASSDQRRLASAAPVSISWRLVRWLPGDQDQAEPEEADLEQDEELAGTRANLRAIRPDGALVFSPFKAAEFRPELHEATYRCCLANRFGQLCSRPVRTRAVIDSAPNLEVFDEFVLASNSVILSCQAPSHLNRYLDHVAWLKDDKIIASRQQQPPAESEDATARMFGSTNLKRRPQPMSSGSLIEASDRLSPAALQQRQKYLMLPSGKLLIRSASKTDSATYKCRARHRLTGSTMVSKIGGQLMVDDTSSKSALRLTAQQPLIWARENSEVFVCAQFQSLPVATLSWFWQPANAGERRPIGTNEAPDIRLLQPQATCLVIQQAQQRHSGFYTCEASNGESTQVSTSRLVVNSVQLTAQLSVQATSASQPQRQTRDQFSALHVVQMGSSPLLNCSISGQPYQVVSWYKDSKLIAIWSAKYNRTNTARSNKNNNNPNIKLVQQTVIQIENFGLKDRGVYQCQAYSSRIPAINEFLASPPTSASSPAPSSPQPSMAATGHQEELMKRDYLRSASASVQLDVALSRPVLSQRFASQTVAKGSAVSLQCAATALPGARIVWFLDNEPIGGFRSASSDSGDPMMMMMMGHNQQNVELASWAELDLPVAYTIESAQEQQDGGGGQIRPGQLMGGDEMGGAADATDDLTMVLGLQQRANLQHYEPIGDERFLVTAHLASGSPSVASGQPLIVSQLNISQVSASETGHYKCVAFNALGHVQHAAQISVLGGSAELRAYQPTNVTLIAGRSATLQCPLVGFPLARVDWFKNDQRLPTSHRQRIEPIKGGLGGQLELANVDKLADAGLYSCRPTLAPDPQAERQDDGLLGQLQVRVRVAPLIDAQSLPEIVKANEGMRTKLVCSVVQGDHPVEIRWLRRARDRNKAALVGGWRLPGLELVQNSAQTGSEENHEESVTILNLEDSCLLTFKQISYADSGDYLCLARNEFSRTMRWTRVVVSVAPTWSAEPASELNIMLGSRLHLECLAHGFPTPIVTWKRQLAASVNRQLAGATAGTGERIATSLIGQNSDQQQAQSGSQLDYTDLITNFRERIHPNGSLTIDHVEQFDGGNYMCEVANGIGTGLSKVLKVKVNVPPYFNHRTGTQVSLINGRAELRCVAYGDQPMVIGWRKDGDIVDLLGDGDGNRHRQVAEHRLGSQAHESLLAIQSLSRNDSGLYVCVASNEFGTEESQLQLLVQEPPEPPVLMRPIRAGSRQATLSFKAPYAGNSPIRKYAILFKQVPSAAQASAAGLGLMSLDAQPAGSAEHQWANTSGSNNNKQDNLTQNGWKQVVVDSPVAAGGQQDLSPDFVLANFRGNESIDSLVASGQLVSLNLCCLQPYSRYMVRVRAINDVGQSEPSKVVQLATDEEAIGGPPLDVGVETTGAHSLRVRWRAPAKNMQNGLVRGYYIGYRAINPPTSGLGAGGPMDLLQQQQRAGSQQLQQAPAISGSAPGVKVLEGPADGEQYQYKNVQLDFSAPNFHQHSPMQPAAINQQASPFNGSSGLAAAGATPAHPMDHLAAPQVYTSYLTNLRRKTAYSIIVQAYNKIGAGPRSDQIIVTTLDAAPPMSPILRLVSVSYNSALLTWSGRRFSQQHGLPKQSNSSSAPLVGHRVFALGEGGSSDEFEAEEDDDPNSYYTLNFRTDDPLRGLQGAGGQNDDDWQQRRLPKRQPLPYVLSNLKCGSHHTAYMTATNSLGQSEPGDSVRFATMGAAPIAPTNSRDFLQVNSTYVLLRLGAWQSAGCTIGSFLFKYRASNQLKWTIVEHQVHPTIQTVTISGSAVFSTRPLGPEQPAEERSPNLDHNQKLNKQQPSNGDFVIRNLLIGLTYRLVVEANSEAGATVADYELDTANFSSTTVSISVNGILASESQQQQQQLDSRTNPSRTNYLDSLNENSNLEPDFSYSGGQRASSFAQRYTFGVWSLTALFVVASVLMAGTALVLGLRSVMRMKPLAGSGAGGGDDGFSSAVLCCLSSAASSSSSSGRGTDSNSSSGGGTCYQVSEHPLEAYCSSQAMAAAAGHGLQMLNSDGTPTGHQRRGHRARLGSISNSDMTMLDASGPATQLDGGELKSIMGLADSVPFRQLVSSSSLSTIGGLRLGAAPSGPTSEDAANQQHQRQTHTLARVSDCQRRFSGHGDSPLGQLGAGPMQRFRAAQYAATLGKHQSSFMQPAACANNLQPIKYNTSNLIYGKLQAAKNNINQDQALDQQHYVTGNQLAAATMSNSHYQAFHGHHPMSSSNGTVSGYETGTNSGRMNSDDTERQTQTAATYLQSAVDSYNQQMYGQNEMLDPTTESNMFTGVATNQRAAYDPEVAMNLNQGQFHYNVPNVNGSKSLANANGHCQQQPMVSTLSSISNDYGMLFSGQINQLAQQQQHQDSMNQLQHLNMPNGQ